MRKSSLAIIVVAAMSLCSCGPQAFTVRSDMRGPSKSGLNLSGKSMAVVYLYDKGTDTLFNGALAEGFAVRLEEDYYGGGSHVDIFKMKKKAGGDYASKDSLVNLVMDTGKDVIFLFDSPDYGNVSVSEPGRVVGKKVSADSAYVSTATVPYSTKLYVYDSMNAKEDKVLAYSGSKEIKRLVYSDGMKSPEEIAADPSPYIYPSVTSAGSMAAESFMSTWNSDTFYVIYYENAEKAWDTAASKAYNFQWKEAMEDWMTLLKTKNNEKKACACYNIALSCLMLGQPGLAGEWLDRADKEMPVDLSKKLRSQVEKYGVR